jgi:hypothetical protein
VKKRKEFEIFPAGKSLQGLLPGFLKEVDDRRAKDLEKVIHTWMTMLDPSYAARTKVEKFQDGFLFIKVSSAALHSILEVQEKKRLLEAMQKKHPRLGLKNIVFRR